MYTNRPLFVLIPITTVLCACLAIIYTGFYYLVEPMSLAQDCGYGLFIISKWLTVFASIGAIYVIHRNRSDLSLGGSVANFFMLATVLGILAAHKMREPTKEEMQIYLEEHLYNYGSAPKYLIEIQQINNCCGIVGYEDYNRIARDATKFRVPSSCCKNPRSGCGKNVRLGSPAPTRSRININGCMPSGMKDMGQDYYRIYKTICYVPMYSVLWDIGILIIFLTYFRRIRMSAFNARIMMTSDTGNVMSNVCIRK